MAEQRILMKQNVRVQQFCAAANKWCQAAHGCDLTGEIEKLVLLLDGYAPRAELLGEGLLVGNSGLKESESCPESLGDSPRYPSPRTSRPASAGDLGVGEEVVRALWEVRRQQGTVVDFVTDVQGRYQF